MDSTSGLHCPLFILVAVLKHIGIQEKNTLLQRNFWLMY